MLTGPGPTSSTPPILNVRNGHAEGTSDHCKDDQDNNSEPPNLARTISYDPTPYVQNVRVSKVVPTKPACNPLQFVQIKPCNLYQSAQEQLKRSEEVKKVQEIKKEEPEDWQSNLDNWKSCRRKRVEHIIDRVVEVKKLEMEDHDRTRRKSKTFSEMLEERGTKGRKLSLAAYGRYDDANDLSDLGIGTSSIKGKGNSSEDSDNQISISGNLDIIKSCLTDLEVNENNNYNNNKNKNNNNNINNNNNDDNNNNNNNNDNNDDDSDKNEKNSKKIDNRLPKTCYDSSNSKTSIGSSNQCEYTYEGAIQDYKLRILKASQLMNISTLTPEVSKTDTTLTSSNDFMNNEPKCSVSRDNTINPPSTSSITNKIADFELKSTEINEDGIVMKKDLLSKINVVNRRELFEKDNNILTLSTDKSTIIPSSSSTKSIKKHLLNLEKRDDINIKDASIVKLNRLSAEFGETTSGSKSVKERLINLERSEVPPSTVSIATASQIANAVKPKIDIPVVPIRDRLISLQSIKPNNQPSVDALCQNVQNNYNNNINRNKQETSDVIKSTPINTLLINEIIDHEPSNDKNTDESSKQIIVNNKPDVARILHEITTESTGATISNVTKKNEISPNSAIEDLQGALHVIDTDRILQSKQMEPIKNVSHIVSTNIITIEPVYQNIEQMKGVNYIQNNSDKNNDNQKKHNEINTVKKNIENEPFYDEIPKQRPIPLYENIDIYYATNNISYPILDQEQMKLQKKIAFPLSVIQQNNLEPPSEKPPPPPVDDNKNDMFDNNNENFDDYNDQETIAPKKNIDQQYDAVKRMNSTKRLKKEIRNKRSSFLGIEDNNIDTFLELSVAPPPDMMSAFIQEERRLEKQMYVKAGLYDSSDTTESRDSGVSENHSRQSSEPVTISSSSSSSTAASEEHDDYINKIQNNTDKESNNNIASNSDNNDDENINLNNKNSQSIPLPQQKQWNFIDNYHTDNKQIILNPLDGEKRLRCIEDQIREQEDVLRVERELLQLEQEELKRQRNNLLIRENLAHHELIDYRTKMLISSDERRRSLQDIPHNNIGHIDNSYNISHKYRSTPLNQPHQTQQQNLPHISLKFNNLRQSMPNLNDIQLSYDAKKNEQLSLPTTKMKTVNAIPTTPPAKPLRLQQQFNTQDWWNREMTICNSKLPSANGNTDVNKLKNYQKNYEKPQQQYNNYALHTLSAVPTPKFQNRLLQGNNLQDNTHNDRLSDAWLNYQQHKPVQINVDGNNNHWLIQEAEQRRNNEQMGLTRSTTNNGWSNYNNLIHRKGSNDNKPLPEAVIQTITQRVQNCRLGERKKFEHTNITLNPVESTVSTAVKINTPSRLSMIFPQYKSHQLNSVSPDSKKEILSVSGKKKCSYCAEELGRGAAMIIESLRLFYHLDCFKCCVCRIQLGDGISGADVRVRNQQLHCPNCFSSDDGIKFSCV